jgi:hypothetical protein
MLKLCNNNSDPTIGKVAFQNGWDGFVAPRADDQKIRAADGAHYDRWNMSVC